MQNKSKRRVEASMFLGTSPAEDGMSRTSVLGGQRQEVVGLHGGTRPLRGVGEALLVSTLRKRSPSGFTVEAAGRDTCGTSQGSRENRETLGAGGL